MLSLTERELNQLYWLNRETEKLQQDLRKLETLGLYKAPIITDVPRGNSQDDKIAAYVAELLDLKGIVTANLTKIFHERSRLERYIDTVDDAEMRLIIRLRHINGLTWEEIGYEVNRSKSGVFRKYQRYLKKCQQIQQEHVI